jgi:hypothetical protein
VASDVAATFTASVAEAPVGLSLAGGDLTGDGAPDVLVGSPFADAYLGYTTPSGRHRRPTRRAKGAEGRRPRRRVRTGGPGPAVARCRTARPTKRLRRAPGADLARASARGGAPNQTSGARLPCQPT